MQYHGWLLISASLYLILTRRYKECSWKYIYEKFKFGSKFLFESENDFNPIFSNFVKICFGINIQDLLPYINHAAKVCGFKFNYSFPDSMKNKDLAGVSINFIVLGML